ncbi:fluoride efflux transporter CrcB [Bradyrhizobium sp. HKCCYLR20261]|uniref:fluoride efflux transporter CrcB n=1 Tax=unclassified Bradyrhizobium TaxID=2631580 RepID=UPI003EBD9929
MPIEAYLLVGLGGAIGGASRFIVSDGIALRWGTTFPWGTLVVNVTGALLIGMVVALARVHGGVFAGASTHDLVITGVLGGYTTVSSFSLQTVNLVLDHRTGLAALNVIASTVLCLAAVAVGYFGTVAVAGLGA